ncbi:hypothetical protein [Roseobacter sp. HKCCD7870]|uniref:hypothetical protein n=1 Tax=Roseobacter sp. HKCCD7870 TaxID=3120343 RepID=UPI0030EDDDCC
MILIASAAYCREDIAVEIGMIPPAFLPIGNKRLFELQYLSLQHFGEEIWLSLPEGFEVSLFDARLLDSLNIKTMFVPENLTLSQSIAFCIEKTNPKSHVRILFGDTNCQSLPSEKIDTVAVATRCDDSIWGYLEKNILQQDKVIVGYFCFLQIDRFLLYLKEESENFVKAVNRYALDVKAEIIDLENWQDFGHRNQYFLSKTNTLLTRHFNNISISGDLLVKHSKQVDKISSEYNWYKSLPLSLSLHTPRLASDLKIENGGAQYELEIIPSFSFSELLIYGNNSDLFWENLFKKLKHLLKNFNNEVNALKDKKFEGADFEKLESSLYLEKTLKRISQQESLSGWDLSEYRRIATDAAKHISKTSKHHLTIAHGDMCFSNILYSSHNERIYLIDPKGLSAFSSNPLVGDIRYEIAKLFHSLVGGYDHIIGNKFILEGEAIEFYPDDYSKIEHLSKKFIHIILDEFSQVSLGEILAINVLLFISMVPLHSDDKDRQEAFLLNSKRLYQMLLKWRKN